MSSSMSGYVVVIPNVDPNTLSIRLQGVFCDPYPTPFSRPQVLSSMFGSKLHSFIYSFAVDKNYSRLGRGGGGNCHERDSVSLGGRSCAGAQAAPAKKFEF